VVVVIYNRAAAGMIDGHHSGGTMDLIWNGNIEHIAEHGLTQDDVQFVFNNPVGYGESRSTGDPAVFGYTPDGRYIIVVYAEIDVFSVYPVTAFEVPEPNR